MGFGVGLGMQSTMVYGDSFDFPSTHFGTQLKVGDYTCDLTPEEQELIRRVEEE